MTDTSPKTTSHPTARDYFVGLVVAFLTLAFPRLTLSLLLLVIVVIGLGSTRFGQIVAGLLIVYIALSFPSMVVVMLLISVSIILAGKYVAPKLQRLAS